MTKRRIAIVGAGGFAREVEWLISEINAVKVLFEFVGFVVSDLGSLGERDSRERVVGDLSRLAAPELAIDCVALGVGTPAARLKLAAEVGRLAPELEWPALVHPSVRYHAESCTFEQGSIVCAGTIATVNVTVSEHAMVNLSCTLGHEAIVGPGSALNPTVNISGGVKIGEGVLVGTGAQVLQYVEIGAAATVGAGAVVTKNVGAGETVVGVPARSR